MKKWYRDCYPEQAEAVIENAKMLYGNPREGGCEVEVGSPKSGRPGSVGVYVLLPEDHAQSAQNNAVTAAKAAQGPAEGREEE